MRASGRSPWRDLDVSDLFVGYGEIALPSGVAGIGLGEAVGDGEAVLVGFEGGGQIALVDLDVADLFVGDGEIALPSCVSGIGLGEAVGDGEAVLIGFEGVGEIALGDLDVSDLFVGDGEIALEVRAVRLQEEQPLKNLLGGGRRRQRAFRLAESQQGLRRLVQRPPLGFVATRGSTRRP